MPPWLAALPVSLMTDGGRGQPSAWEVRDLNLVRTEPPEHLQDYRGSPSFERIREVLGFARHREAIRVDMASAAGCTIFVTDNPDILRRRERLEAIVPMRFLHPVREAAVIRQTVSPAPQ